MIRKEKISDFLEHLSNDEHQRHYEKYILQEISLPLVYKEERLNAVKNNEKKILNIMM